MKAVLAGGNGTLGRRLADHLGAAGYEVVILTRSPRPGVAHRQLGWDGRTVGEWAQELEGALVVNLAGLLVERRPTPANVDALTRSRVEPTRALAAAAAGLARPPSVWIQMSTMAIYGDAGEVLLDESHPPADGPAQMAGVARAWEEAACDVRAERMVVLRTGLVLDRGAPVIERLSGLVRWGLGGRIGSGEQWVSWIHIEDFLQAVTFVIDQAAVEGVVHVTAPTPVRNRDMMAALRSVLGRPWSPPVPAVMARLGAFLLRSDPALALTGRRGVPGRLLEAGFVFRHPTFAGAVADVAGRPQPVPA